MSKESFLLLDLKEDKAKDLAKVINNESCRKILDYLSQIESATESEISEKLNIPLSTVHYNLQQLSKSRLITDEEFHYSKKGKEVTHYSLANKFIIIAPSKKEGNEGIMNKLKDILPFGIFGILATGFVSLFTKSKQMNMSASFESAREISDFAPKDIGSAQLMTTKTTQDFAVQAVNNTPQPQIVQETVNAAQNEPNAALWFGLGILTILIFIIIFRIIKYKFFKKNR